MLEEYKKLVKIIERYQEHVATLIQICNERTLRFNTAYTVLKRLADRCPHVLLEHITEEELKIIEGVEK